MSDTPNPDRLSSQSPGGRKGDGEGGFAPASEVVTPGNDARVAVTFIAEELDHETDDRGGRLILSGIEGDPKLTDLGEWDIGAFGGGGSVFNFMEPVEVTIRTATRATADSEATNDPQGRSPITPSPQSPEPPEGGLAAEGRPSDWKPGDVLHDHWLKILRGLPASTEKPREGAVRHWAIKAGLVDTSNGGPYSDFYRRTPLADTLLKTLDAANPAPSQSPEAEIDQRVEELFSDDATVEMFVDGGKVVIGHRPPGERFQELGSGRSFTDALRSCTTPVAESPTPTQTYEFDGKLWRHVDRRPPLAGEWFIAVDGHPMQATMGDESLERTIIEPAPSQSGGERLREARFSAVIGGGMTGSNLVVDTATSEIYAVESFDDLRELVKTVNAALKESNNE